MTLQEIEEFVQRIEDRKLESYEAEMVRAECLAVIKELLAKLPKAEQ
ncbi:MAG: hypothetical protein FWE76_05385 [Symbiobacteriaceae bacterium]|nr:hypothetical protein [Symbiobacteriaceae bacterium]